MFLWIENVEQMVASIGVIFPTVPSSCPLSPDRIYETLPDLNNDHLRKHGPLDNICWEHSPTDKDFLREHMYESKKKKWCKKIVDIPFRMEAKL